MFIVTVDQDACVGCTECTAACPAKILEMNDNKAYVAGDECLGCQSCEMICPASAIKVQEL